MKMQKEVIALILFAMCGLSHAQLQTIIPAALLTVDVVKWSVDFWNYVKTGQRMVSKFSESFGETCSNERKYTSAITGKVIQTIPEISAELEEIGKIIKYRNQELEKTIAKLKLDIDVDMRMFALVQSMGVIDHLYERLRDSVPARESTEFIPQDHCSFAYNQIYGDPLSAKVDNMFNIIVSSEQLLSSLIAEIFTQLETNKEAMCDTGHSTLEYLHSIYNALLLVEIKAYVMTTFSHNLLFNFNGTGSQCEYHQQSPNPAIKAAQMKLRDHLQAYDKAFLKEMNEASREFRACDQGDDFIRDETYFELEGTIQVTVEFPTNWPTAVLNEEEPKDLKGVKAYGTPAVYCDPSWKFCTTPMARNCRGWTHSCQTTSYSIRGCLAEKASPRRYEWLRWQSSWRKDPFCPKNLKMDLSNSIQEYNTDGGLNNFQAFYWVPDRSFRPYHCQCNDNDVDSISTHIFNLQWVESDVSQNMVITGLRFIVVHRVMQFQIQQGKLIDNFRVQEGEWKPINDISEHIRATRLNRTLRGKSPGVLQDRDFMVIDQGINNAISFDTLHVPHLHVLTGVRFRLTEGKVEISLKATKFDHITGALCTDCEPAIVTSDMHHEKLYNYPKKNVNHPKFPTRAITSPGEYVKIETSDVLADSGQTTLPFFDALPLVSSPPAPIGGLGIFLKGNEDFAGLLSLKFVSLDYPMYMKKSSEDLEKEINLFSLSGKKIVPKWE